MSKVDHTMAFFLLFYAIVFLYFQITFLLKINRTKVFNFLIDVAFCKQMNVEGKGKFMVISKA
ncbi:MAG: hypothetical protein JW731_02565, partial [Bacteroidales bacterium]|nr:hypothetical protein [Bacteroidales bacterium]